MPIRNTAFPIHYRCYDEFTGELIADDPMDHTFILVRDGTSVTPSDTGTATDEDGINYLSITSGENTGYVNTLKIATTTPGVVIPTVTWTNDYGDLDTLIAAIKAKTDNLPSDPADASDVAGSFSTVNATLATIASYIDTEVAAIKAKTDNLPADPADASDIAAAFGTVNTTLSTIAGYIDTEVAAIKAKTDNLPSDPADASDISAAFSTVNSTLGTIAGYVDTEIAAIKAVTDKVDTALEDDGASGFQFTTLALENGPSGGGGSADWTADEKAAIRAILGIPGSGTTPADPTVGILDTIRDAVVAVLADTNELQTDLANGGRLDLLIDAIVAAVSGTQAINLVPRWTQGVINIVRGDDYDGVSQPKIYRDFVDTANDLTTWSATMTWRRHGSSESDAATFSETVTPTLVAANTYRFAFAPVYAQTGTMAPVPNGYYYDVQLKDPTNKRFTVETGIINVTRDATLG